MDLIIKNPRRNTDWPFTSTIDSFRSSHKRPQKTKKGVAPNELTQLAPRLDASIADDKTGLRHRAAASRFPPQPQYAQAAFSFGFQHANGL